MAIYLAIKKLDFFPAGFRLSINGEKGKKTLFGAAITVLITLISLAYLIYILNEWISGVTQPYLQ